MQICRAISSKPTLLQKEQRKRCISTLKRCDKGEKEDKFQNQIWEQESEYMGSFLSSTGDSQQKSILRVHPQTPNFLLVYLQHQQEKQFCGRWNREFTLDVEYTSDISLTLFPSSKRHNALSQRNAVKNLSLFQRYNNIFHQCTSCRCNTCQCLLALKCKSSQATSK